MIEEIAPPEQESANRTSPTYTELLDSQPDMHPDIRAHVERLAHEAGELSTEATVQTEAVSTESSTPSDELLARAKSIVFLDKRGIERRPSPYAAEIYATPDIQQAVGEHFIEVDAVLETITRELDAIVQDKENGKWTDLFKPLSEDLLKQVLKITSKQIPGLTRSTTTMESRLIKTGRIIKRSHIVDQEVTREQKVTGYTTSGDDEDTKRAWQQAIGSVLTPTFDYGAKPEELPSLEKKVANELLNLLTGTEAQRAERLGHGTDQSKLPLLAVRIDDSDLNPEQINNLDWENIYQLVPEASKMIDDIRSASNLQSSQAELKKLNDLRNRLRQVSPEGCRTVALLYYSEEQLAILNNLQKEINLIEAPLKKTLHPDKDLEYNEKDFMDKQHDSIATFFDFRQPAYTIYIHGTVFGPRVVSSGILKPSQSMSDEEFTFGTDRSRQEGTGAVSGQDGSRGVHWAALGKTNYARNYSQQDSVQLVQQMLSQRFMHRPDLVEKELQKGGFGNARFTIRLGDLVSITPYADNVLDSARKEGKSARFGAVELTERGWNMISGNLSRNGGEDVAYSAAPGYHDLSEVYKYGYPIDLMLIGIPSKDPDSIKTILREKGWTDQKIEEHTYIFEDIPGAAELAIPSKYPRSVVVPISEDL